MSLQALMGEAARAFSAGDMVRAEPLFRHIVAANPRDHEAWHALAVITCRSGRAADAVDCAMKAHKLDRRNHFYLNTMGVACSESGRLEESLRWFRRALKEKPNHAETHYNLGKLLKKLGQYDAAEQSCRSALNIDPSMADAANNLASLYIRTGRYKEALSLLDRARKASSDVETVAINTSQALLGQHGPPAAIEHLSHFLEGHPNAAQVHFRLALRLLAQGNFAEGWREYAWRHRVPGEERLPGLAQHLPQDLRGRTLVLLPSQGLGDQLFFLRFAVLLRERGARVLFACVEKLLPILQHTPALDGVFAPDLKAPPDLPDATMVSVGDLPLLLETAAAPAPLPVVVPPECIPRWREHLASLGPPPYLGVTWRGGSKKQSEAEFVPAGLAPLFKDIEIELLAQAVRHWPGTLLILQRLPAPSEVARFCRASGRKVHDLSALNEHLQDMSAVLGLIEEYVGVSNTNMHIRAGVGRSAHVLVPFPAEFRWMDEGDGSPWFPGFKVYRQPPSRDWADPLRDLRNKLST